MNLETYEFFKKKKIELEENSKEISLKLETLENEELLTKINTIRKLMKKLIKKFLKSLSITYMTILFLECLYLGCFPVIDILIQILCLFIVGGGVSLLMYGTHMDEIMKLKLQVYENNCNRDILECKLLLNEIKLKPLRETLTEISEEQQAKLESKKKELSKKRYEDLSKDYDNFIMNHLDFLTEEEKANLSKIELEKYNLHILKEILQSLKSEVNINKLMKK